MVDVLYAGALLVLGLSRGSWLKEKEERRQELKTRIEKLKGKVGENPA